MSSVNSSKNKENNQISTSNINPKYWEKITEKRFDIMNYNIMFNRFNVLKM